MSEQGLAPPPTFCNRMDEPRIAELLAPFLSSKGQRHEQATGARDSAALSPAQLRSISMYIDLLLRWNARINLTGVRQPEEIVTRHFGESFFAARCLFPEAGGEPESGEAGQAAAHPHVIDVGSGAGFPGLPIKLWAPRVQLTLIESNQKKATFLKEVVRNLNLASAEVFAGRADAFLGPRGGVVTFRAVEHFESILPVAAGLVGPGGRLAILVGQAQLDRVRELVPGFKWSAPNTLPLSDSRSMIIGRNEP
jgi:16S rRNA (guanine527-N7)-methyltransferase